jgi:hypothetical protein
MAIFACEIDASAQTAPQVIHVFVALCDNTYQGIIPVPSKLGNGDDPKNNLYWGAKYGVKTFLKKSRHWKLISTMRDPSKVPQPTINKSLEYSKPSGPPVLERCIFRHAKANIYLIADAYQGRQIKQTVLDFLNAASGTVQEKFLLPTDTQSLELPLYGDSNLLIYVGHDGLMDFQLPRYPQKQDDRKREVMILACKSRQYFAEPIIQAGAKPLLWTSGLMAPETYTLESAVEGWILHESDDQIRLRAATAYHTYQKCGLNAAKRLLVTGME